MHPAQLDTRTPHRASRCAIILVATLLACIGTLAYAMPTQDATGPTANHSPAAAVPVGRGVGNAPPAPLSEGQRGRHSLITDREQVLSYSILFFGLAVLIVQYLLLRSPKRDAFEILQLLAINLIVTGTLFLISAGFDAQQISPGLGLFGTIAGYVLGRRAGEGPKRNEPADNNRGAT